jgi:hypothetical protein
MACSIRPQSAASLAVNQQIMKLHDAGVSVRQIERLLWSIVKKTFINDIIRGKRRGLSERRAIPALARFEEGGGGWLRETRVLTEDGWRWLAPLTDKDFAKNGRHLNYVGRAKTLEDYGLVSRQLTRSELTIRVAGASGKARTVHLEARHDVLRRLARTGRLTRDDLGRYREDQVVRAA